MPAGDVGHDGATGELFVKGGMGESAGGYSRRLYLKVVTGASGIQKMKPSESDDPLTWRSSR